jgi:2,5-diketo-D-gluconate reductase A
MTSIEVPALAMNDGHAIPQLGFGVFQVPPEDTAAVVASALEAGLRHIDTASAYRNERGVGEALRASGLPREEVFVTTKCWNADHGAHAAREACERSLERLGLEAVDLYLIHWPVPAEDRYVETWETFIDLREAGLVRSIGVSNFDAGHLDRIVDETGVTPAVNQVELHPAFQQPALREHHARLGILTEAWAPLAQGELWDDPVLGAIAGETGRTTAQVMLRWHLQSGNVAIPKTVSPERMRENLGALGWELSEDAMARIAALDEGRRIGPDPATFALK